VERRPVNRTLSSGELERDSDLLRDRTIEMTETAEEAVVAKEAQVREELVVRKAAEEHTETVDDTVRRTEVDVNEGVREGSDRSAFGGFQNRANNDQEAQRTQGDLGRTEYDRTDRDKGL
jgi:stress response protein YsnF